MDPFLATIALFGTAALVTVELIVSRIRAHNRRMEAQIERIEQSIARKG